MRLSDLTGKHFGRLCVLSRYGVEWPVKWNCICKCGMRTVVYAMHLKRGASTSCGCYQREWAKEKHTTHGHLENRAKTGVYSSYVAAKSRCNNPNNNRYYLYGGRGIQFKFDSFEDFYKELGDRPKGKTIDRKDPNGHYEVGNVKWSTAKQQANNKRCRQ